MKPLFSAVQDPVHTKPDKGYANFKNVRIRVEMALAPHKVGFPNLAPGEKPYYCVGRDGDQVFELSPRNHLG